MKTRLLRYILALGVAFSAPFAWADARGFSFAVIFHPSKDDAGETMLRDALNETDEQNLSFVVSNGIKSAVEPCSDRLYERRKSLLDSAKNGLIMSLAASDWTECKGTNGKSAAAGRLNRMRELFFTDEFSMGSSKIPLIRQSTIARFRSYGENARWEFDNVMFATINLPRNNNHYSLEAGRNGEFEDRQIANKDWLQRVFVYASRKKMDGIVLFCDGDPLQKNIRQDGSRDGFSEVRKLTTALAAKFPGKVLIVHGRTRSVAQDTAVIVWRSNIGTLETRRSWVKVDIAREPGTTFVIAEDSPDAKNRNRSSPSR